MRLILLAGLMLSSGSTAGPISKFADKPAVAYSTSKGLEDVERCLIDMDGLLIPRVLRQPDRPDDVTLVWTGPNGTSVGRIDLHRMGSKTMLKSWFPAKQVEGCAPRA